MRKTLRLSLDARVEIAAGRRLASDLSSFIGAASPAALNATVNRGGSSPNSAGLAGFSSITRWISSVLERAQRATPISLESVGSASGLRRFPRGR